MDELIFLDTETTGNDVLSDRLCQVCYKTGRVMKSGYFKPERPMSVKAMSITNITNRMLADKEPFQGSAMKAELEGLLANGILVAHNAKFDAAMLESEGLRVSRRICTFRLARYLDPENNIPEYNLQYLRYELDLDVRNASAHDARGDVKVLIALFNRQLAEFRAGCKTRIAAIAEMLAVSGRPTLFKLFPFGKYKDKKIEEVVKTDRAYVEWLLAKKVEEGGQDEDWMHTLEYYLRA